MSREAAAELAWHAGSPPSRSARVHAVCFRAEVLRYPAQQGSPAALAGTVLARMHRDR